MKEKYYIYEVSLDSQQENKIKVGITKGYNENVSNHFEFCLDTLRDYTVFAYSCLESATKYDLNKQKIPLLRNITHGTALNLEEFFEGKKLYLS